MDACTGIGSTPSPLWIEPKQPGSPHRSRFCDTCLALIDTRKTACIVPRRLVRDLFTAFGRGYLDLSL